LATFRPSYRKVKFCKIPMCIRNPDPYPLLSTSIGNRARLTICPGSPDTPYFWPQSGRLFRNVDFDIILSGIFSFCPGFPPRGKTWTKAIPNRYLLTYLSMLHTIENSVPLTKHVHYTPAIFSIYVIPPQKESTS